MRALLVMVGLASWFVPASGLGQATTGPDTVTVHSGGLALRGLLWRPTGQGPFPAVLFNHGSYSAGAPLKPSEPAALGPVFASHGYVFLFLCRRGIGLSADQGIADGDLMARALAEQGQAGRNRAQLQLLEDELHEVVDGLAFLRALPGVDRDRVAVAGHSFGGSLTVLLAARDPTLGAAVAFSGSAYSWGLSPDLRELLLASVRRTTVPVFFIHAANDYSVEPGKVLAAEMQWLGKPHRLEIYPAVGGTRREGHNLVYRNPMVWERDVFVFLDQYCRRR
ncbi:MAG TPA: dienelactone hydrolase family protein [Gemmatimonadales bacterium]|nr:dienelactone hydrolase family protein [Gemmatimonadales bacterium]